MRDILRRALKHRAPRAAAGFLIALHVMAIFAGFLAPYDAAEGDPSMRYIPPQRVHILDAGRISFPYVRALTESRDAGTGEIRWSDRPGSHATITLFRRGEAWTFAGLFSFERHLIGASEPMHLLGTDRRGRDLLSRIVVGSQISLSLALFAVVLHAGIGSVLGALSGWYGGYVDLVLQRVIELLGSFPSIPLYMAISAAIPATWPPWMVIGGITVVLSLLSWGSLARQIRGRILTEREADYVIASRAAGAGGAHIIRRHLLPAVAGHIVVQAATTVPGFILAETALSFLGLGVRSPMVSWGLLLSDAQHVRVVLQYWWLLFAALPAVFTVIAWNILADALRDAFDPRHTRG